MSKAVCARCRHEIDEAARICPYCGADPRTGEKPIDTQALLEEVFHPRQQLTATEELLQYARQRQGIVIALTIFAVVMVLAGFHQIVMRRNASAVTDASAVPLTDIADLNNQSEESRTLPMPELQYQYDGHPQTMRTFIVEPGAVPPPSAATNTIGPPAPAPAKR